MLTAEGGNADAAFIHLEMGILDRTWSVSFQPFLFEGMEWAGEEAKVDIPPL